MEGNGTSAHAGQILALVGTIHFSRLKADLQIDKEVFPPEGELAKTGAPFKGTMFRLGVYGQFLWMQMK